RRLPLRRRPLVQGARRAADAANASLGRRRLRRLDRPPHAACLLHRRFPEAARSDLLPRSDDAGVRAARGLSRLLARRRPPLRDGACDRLLGADVGAVRGLGYWVARMWSVVLWHGGDTV